MRSRRNKRIAGVCGGVAEYFEVDPLIVRLLWVAVLILPIPGAILSYLIGWIVMPMEPETAPAAGYAAPVSA